MDRRTFLSWLGGGIAATVALSQGQVLDAQRLFGVSGEVDPQSLLWMPGEAKIILPPDKPLVIAERLAGVACYRVTNRAGSYWYDERWYFIDAFDRRGAPRALLDGEAPDLRSVKSMMAYSQRDRAVDRGLEVTRWKDLLTPTERTIVAKVAIGPWEG